MKLFFVLVFILIAVAGAATQTAVVPLVEMGTRGLLGGVQNGRWVAPNRVRGSLREVTEFILVGWDGVEEGGVTLGKKAEIEDVCDDFQRIELELRMERGLALGSNATWNPVPRLPRAIAVNSSMYRAAVSAFLKKKGIPRPTVRIRQAFRIDLEGDGVDEVILSATFYRNGLAANAKAGDYSFVMLRKITGKAVVDHLLKGDFVRRNIDFGAPTQNEISAIADLNGDGTLEVVLFGRYYEGEFASVFEMRNGIPTEIREFSIGCGV